MKRLIIDLDDTITDGSSSPDYANKAPNQAIVERLREYHKRGFEIVIHTSRNMRTHSGNVGKINVQTLPGITAWLEKHEIPHDEIWVGKPWCGFEGFYIDDKAIRPDEFVSLSYDQIRKLTKIDKP
ncbi:capsular biosynthesis protein [Ruegeria arenilitoris]|uniref:capsular biosynthesis protein n=1 Tax=Ruegeria arenilitoris TaxID=1173585 RepID=UPI00147F41B5|nr:capsular biosynthesis protein [Ruegeria arenilitoris]